MKKKGSLLLVGVVCASVALSGCNLFTVDSRAYYNDIVASVGFGSHTVEITKEELSQAYSRHSSSLSESGYDQAGAVEYLVNYLMNQKIMINETDKLIKAGTLKFSNDHLNDVWENAYKNVISLVQDYEEQIYEGLKLDTPSALEEPEEKKTYSPYEHKAEIVYENGEYVVKVIDTAEKDDPNEALIYDKNAGAVETIISAVEDRLGDNEYLLKAKDKYLYYLVERAKSLGESTKEADVWKAEVQRIYDFAMDNEYIEMYEDYLVSSNNGNSIITVNNIFQYLENQIAASYNYYSLSEDTYKTDILENRENVHYFFNNDSVGEYFYVSHSLVKFADWQTEALSALKTQLENGALTQTDYENARQQVVSQTTVKSFGEDVADMTASDLYNALTTDLAGKSDEEKARIFNDYLYEYNEDEGIMSGDYAYIIGTKDSKMVEPFTNASRDLYDNGNGEFGDMSGMVESEYGIHMIFYIKPVQNMFNITNVNNFSLTEVGASELAENIATINNTYLNALTNKTVFDIAYEKLESDPLSRMESLNLTVLRDQLDLVKYTDSYKDMLGQ